MIICLCHRVSDREIVSAARTGCPDFEALQDELRVGTACGACVDCARDQFHAHAASCPDRAGCASHAVAEARAQSPSLRRRAACQASCSSAAAR